MCLRTLNAYYKAHKIESIAQTVTQHVVHCCTIILQSPFMFMRTLPHTQLRTCQLFIDDIDTVLYLLIDSNSQRLTQKTRKYNICMDAISHNYIVC